MIAISAKCTHVATAATLAESDCSANAVSKAGKPLAGAAQTAFMKRCEAEGAATAAPSACTDKAISKAGKSLAGAAKPVFLKKWEQTLKAGNSSERHYSVQDERHRVASGGWNVCAGFL